MELFGDLRRTRALLAAATARAVRILSCPVAVSELDERVESLRLLVYRRFADRGNLGELGTIAELAVASGSSEALVRAGLRTLHEQRHVVLDSQDQVVMAHPFASIPLGFSVMGAHTLWWGGCAWDSFALPHLLIDETDVLVATRCPNCDRPHAWVVDRHRPPAGEEVAHFLTPTAHIWDDVVHSCAHQRLFCSDDCVDEWLAKTGNQRGYTMDLATLWRLASRWYEGRLERGYRRRDPATAAAYFREVGLHGEFWGLTTP
jgi:Alkylmercury lyase